MLIPEKNGRRKQSMLLYLQKEILEVYTRKTTKYFQSDGGLGEGVSRVEARLDNTDFLILFSCLNCRMCYLYSKRERF